MEAKEKRRKIVKRDGSGKGEARRTCCHGEKREIERSQAGFKSKWVITVYLGGQRLHSAGVRCDSGNVMLRKHSNSDTDSGKQHIT